MALMIAAISLTLPGCEKKAPGTEASHAPVTLRYGFVTGVERPSGPIGWALEKGILQAALAKIGITGVSYVRLGGPSLNEALAGGSVDVITLGDTPAIVGRSAGLPVRLVDLESVGSNAVLVVRQDGPKTLQDLVGKKVAYSAGSNGTYYAYALLAEAGLLDKVTLVNVDYTGTAAALLHGDIDAGVNLQGTVFNPQDNGDQVYRVLDYARNHPDLTASTVTESSESFLTAHPDFIAAWNQARAAAIADIQVHPDDYYRFQTSRLKFYPEATVRGIYPLTMFNPDPLPAEGATVLGRTKNFLLSQHLIKDDFAITEWAAAPFSSPSAPVTSGEGK